MTLAKELQWKTFSVGLATLLEGVGRFEFILCIPKCFDIKKVKSLNDLVIIDWVLGGEPTKKNNKKIIKK